MYIHTCFYLLAYIFTIMWTLTPVSYTHLSFHLKAIYSYKLGKGNCFKLSYTSAWTCKKTFPGKILSTNRKYYDLSNNHKWIENTYKHVFMYTR